MTTTRARPARPVMRECDHCYGAGEVEVCCEDCGEELTTENAADPSAADSEVNPDGADLCKLCEAERVADLEAAKAVAALPLPGEGPVKP